MKITRHAYKRARQRLGLNKKAFNRIIKLNKIPSYADIIIKNNVIITVKNNFKETRSTKNTINKMNRNDLII